MTAPERPAGRRYRRRTYVVDRAAQGSVAAWLVGALLGVAVLYLVGIHFLLRAEVVAYLDAEGMRKVLLTTSGVYFGLATGIVAVLALLLTHRFTGPAWVMSQALDGMLEGDFDRRLSLRDRDALKPLAARLDTVRRRWQAREQDVSRALALLERCLEEGRTEEAARVVAGLRATALLREGHPEAARPVPLEAVASAG